MFVIIFVYLLLLILVATYLVTRKKSFGLSTGIRIVGGISAVALAWVFGADLISNTNVQGGDSGMGHVLAWFIDIICFSLAFASLLIFVFVPVKKDLAQSKSPPAP